MIYVLGSINADIVVYSERFPEVGETLVGSDFMINQGGKGANQAIAAQKAGGNTKFVGRIGGDYFGKIVIESLIRAKVSTEVKKEENVFTGLALINVNKNGENKIIIVHGANERVGDKEIAFLENRIREKDILMIQGEINPDVLRVAAKNAVEKNACVIFDPAPVSEQLKSVIPFSTFITPNEVEIKSLTGSSGKEGVNKLFSLGASNVIVKMGESGIRYYGKEGEFEIPAFKVDSVDTTGAGDTFNGAFAAAISSGSSLKNALVFAEAAAAISVTRKGASISAPEKREIEAFLNSRSF